MVPYYCRNRQITKDYSLTNFDNYNKNLEYKIDDIIEKYLLLSNEFLKFILEKLKLKNNNYSKFIIIRGYETITNIFNIILYQTKNLDLTFYHCQKAYYYYIEFIEQISNLDDTLLQLNSRDATTYVYKKTLFELHEETRKKMLPCSNKTKVLLKNIDEYISQNISNPMNTIQLYLSTLVKNISSTTSYLNYVLCYSIYN